MKRELENIHAASKAFYQKAKELSSSTEATKVEGKK
jgi:hypothetical protein